MRKLISLEQARNALKTLGEGVAICLESDESRAAKEAAGKADELWRLELGEDGLTWRIRRGDDKFYDVRWADRGGYGHPQMFQEPNLPDPPEGERRIVGHVIVEQNTNGLVRVRTVKGLNGEVLELKPSSISKGDLAASGEEPAGYFQADPQRIGGGYIAVYHRSNMDFPDTEGMSALEVIVSSTDGRAINAVAKAGLLFTP
ncbi:MAG: hypothetical protein Q7S89_02530 [bacterium]|nr:hypothetical protein [bacterium]